MITTVKVSTATNAMIKKVAVEFGGMSADQAINRLLAEHMVAAMDRWRAEHPGGWKHDIVQAGTSTAHTAADGLDDEPWVMTGWEEMYEESLRRSPA